MLPYVVACEIGFWVVLGAGLLARYVLNRRRLGAALLLAVPLVDVALLVLAFLDLRSGAAPDLSHGLSAGYLGFSVAFGPDLVRWADVRVAHRFRSGPPPVPVPPSGSRARMRKEWRDFALAVLATVLSGAVLAALAAATGPGTDDAPLLTLLPKLAMVLLIWFLGWPLWETDAVAAADRSPSRSGRGDGADGGLSPRPGPAR
jgi:hypothetical protein